MEDKKAIPTVSRVLDDGTLIELLYDPRDRSTAFAVAAPDGSVETRTAFEGLSGERLIPYSATNSLIASECVLLPSEVGELIDQAALLAEVQAFIHRHVDLSPTFEAVAAHYVLLSWVYDAFNELPYLRLRGDFGTGKTRALLAIGSLCYKPFFASGASTVSPLFHVMEAFGGTLVLDEADLRFSDATADLTKILNNGTVRGLPVLRTMTNKNRELNPQAFRVFGPKLIAMRSSFADAALESRFITEDTGGRPLRPDVPIQIPRELREEARELRNALLAWRFAAFHSIRSDPARLVAGLSPRASQTVLSLLSLIEDEEMREAVCAFVGVADDQLRRERPVAVEPLMLMAILEAFEREGSAGAAVGVITNLFNEVAEPLLGRAMTPKWVGAYVRTTLGLSTTRSGGVFAVPHAERRRVAALAARFAPQSTPQSPEVSRAAQSAAEPIERAA